MKLTLSNISGQYTGKVRMVTAVCAACLLTACGGGSGTTPVQSTTASRSAESVAPTGADSAAPSSSTAAASTMVAARGPVSALGTLLVNGVRYDDRTATVRINGRERRLDDLKLGMVVEVQAEHNVATQASVARSVSASSFAEGRVEAIDRVARTIKLMGITVAVPATTVFEGWAGLQDPLFKVGELAEVYGLANGPNGAVATRIERTTVAAVGAEDLALTGVLSQLNTVQKTFMLSGTIVVYSHARIENVGAGLAEGMTVRVEGVSSGAGVITASEINGTQRAAAAVEGFRVEEQGYVSDLVAPLSFKVNGMSVDASEAIVTGTLTNNVRVEVRGVMRNGVLVASKVERDDAGNGRAGGEESKFEGVVSAAVASSFQINGFTVIWTTNTRFDDIASSAIRPGTQLEVQAVWSGTEYVATRIKGED
jgi:hypothetical protein